MNLREIDWFVAEKVMNWHVWENEDGDLMVTKGYGCYSHCPSFSTNIADAWQVVEKLTKDGDYIFTLRYDVNWRCEFFDTTKYEGCSEENPALAICLAALKAYGIEVEAE